MRTTSHGGIFDWRLVSDWMDEERAATLLSGVKRIGFPCGIERLGEPELKEPASGKDA